jgi:hypothetical protein
MNDSTDVTQIHRIQTARNFYLTVEDVNIEIGMDGCTVSYWEYEGKVFLDKANRIKYITMSEQEALKLADSIYKIFGNRS